MSLLFRYRIYFSLLCIHPVRCPAVSSISSLPLVVLSCFFPAFLLSLCPTFLISCFLRSIRPSIHAVNQRSIHPCIHPATHPSTHPSIYPASQPARHPFSSWSQIYHYVRLTRPQVSTHILFAAFDKNKTKQNFSQKRRWATSSHGPFFLQYTCVFPTSGWGFKVAACTPRWSHQQLPIVGSPRICSRQLTLIQTLNNYCAVPWRIVPSNIWDYIIIIWWVPWPDVVAATCWSLLPCDPQPSVMGGHIEVRPPPLATWQLNGLQRWWTWWSKPLCDGNSSCWWPGAVARGGKVLALPDTRRLQDKAYLIGIVSHVTGAPICMASLLKGATFKDERQREGMFFGRDFLYVALCNMMMPRLNIVAADKCIYSIQNVHTTLRKEYLHSAMPDICLPGKVSLWMMFSFSCCLKTCSHFCELGLCWVYWKFFPSVRDLLDLRLIT